MKFTDSFSPRSIMAGALNQNKREESGRRATSMFLRPTQESQHYRFRLLNFYPDEEYTQTAGLRAYRDFPFILRYVHTAWIHQPDPNDPSKVRNVSRTIVCPQSDYVKANSDLTKKACPICSAGNRAYATYRDSNFKSQAAKEKMSACRNSFEALLPVYVINDPSYDANNGTVKVLVLREREYQKVAALIQTRGNTPIWNDNAVDLYLTYGRTTITLPPRGNAPAFSFEGNDILKIGFTPTPHAIDNIEALVKDLEFDQNWYTIPTIEELQDFYTEHFAVSSDTPNDIPDDIPDSVPATPVAKEPAVNAEKPASAPVVETPAPKPAPAPVAPAPKPAAPAKPNTADLDADIDSFLAGLPGMK